MCLWSLPRATVGFVCTAFYGGLLTMEETIATPQASFSRPAGASPIEMTTENQQKNRFISGYKRSLIKIEFGMPNALPFANEGGGESEARQKHETKSLIAAGNRGTITWRPNRMEHTKKKCIKSSYKHGINKGPRIQSFQRAPLSIITAAK